MFAYQARPRVLHLDDGRPLEFPNDVRVRITFAPNTGLGGEHAEGRTAIVGQRPTFTWNANLGKMTVHNEEPLDEVRFEGVVLGISAHLNGHTLELHFQCPSVEVLLRTINVFHHVLPLILGVSFVDPPVITTTSGDVAGVPFTWHMQTTRGSGDTTSVEIQEARVAEAMRRLATIVAPPNRRLLAALSYFNRAVRLGASGATGFEFTAEVVLNLAKCLEVLFPGTEGRTRDGVRSGLASLGYSESDIETWFLPAMALRSQVDVAHVRLTWLTYEQLMTIQYYTEAAEDKFRQMMQRLLTAVEERSFAAPPYEDKGPDIEVTATLERLKKSLINAANRGELR